MVQCGTGNTGSHALRFLLEDPTFDVVARPGAFADYFGGNNPEGKSLREITGEPMRAVDAFRSAEPRLHLLDED